MPPPPRPAPPPRLRRRRPGALLALLALVWFAAGQEVSGRAATGLAGRILGGALVPLVSAAFLLFLLVLGFAALDLLRGEHRSVRLLLQLPARSTARGEWGLGAALGWASAIAAILPLALAGALHPQLWLDARSVPAAIISLATVALSTLAAESVFRGYALRRLSESTGRTLAVLLLALIFALFTAATLGAWAVLIAFLWALLLTTGWLRTHALWLSWGLSFAWNAALAVLFGVPLPGGTDLSNIVQTQLHGGRWLIGFGLGPVAAPCTTLVLLVAIALLVWFTRNLAWTYTHKPIIAAGFPMDVAPPAAHTAMEAAAPSLVQILPQPPPRTPIHSPAAGSPHPPDDGSPTVP